MSLMSSGQAQYATVHPLIQASIKSNINWIPADERERLAAYNKYEEIYWNQREAFQLLRRGTEMQPLYLPNAMTVCDETAHFFMKNMTFTGKDQTLEKFLEPWIKTTKWMSKWLVNKHAGVVRGDWVFHMVADKDADDGKKVQIIPIDPARFFPEYDDEDDIDNLTAISLAESFEDHDRVIRIHKLTYRYVMVGGNKRIETEEGVYDTDPRAWAKGAPPLNRQIVPPQLLPAEFTMLPVFHFKNRDWQGDVYGSSELRGHERLMSSMDQSISDAELALALEGLGVYHTDAGAPIDQVTGQPTAWVISPGQVLEIPTGTSFGRVKGIDSLDPLTTYLETLQNALWEASATSNLGKIDVGFAADEDALTVRFMPTAAKLEEREYACTEDVLEMFQEWMKWYSFYETEMVEDDTLDILLGDKLPVNRVKLQTELNNMLDRDVISRKEYRRVMSAKLGYKFTPDEELEQEIQDEQEELSKFQIKGGPFGWPGVDPATGAPTDANGNPVSTGTGKPLAGTFNGKPEKAGSTLPRGNGSNNSARPNESKGTEPNQTTTRQQKVRPR